MFLVKTKKISLFIVERQQWTEARPSVVNEEHDSVLIIQIIKYQLSKCFKGSFLLWITDVASEYWFLVKKKPYSIGCDFKLYSKFIKTTEIEDWHLHNLYFATSGRTITCNVCQYNIQLWTCQYLSSNMTILIQHNTDTGCLNLTFGMNFIVMI